jgi:hypothetical protein
MSASGKVSGTWCAASKESGIDSGELAAHQVPDTFPLALIEEGLERLGQVRAGAPSETETKEGGDAEGTAEAAAEVEEESKPAAFPLALIEEGLERLGQVLHDGMAHVDLFRFGRGGEPASCRCPL